MKQIYLFFTCLLFLATAHAEGPQPEPGKNAVVMSTVTKTATVAQKQLTAVKQGTIQFRFNDLAVADESRQDSVLIIFDRYNHTGAGVVYQVFAADKDHCITIPAVPAGKYYVTIQCLGMHRDRVERLVTIKAKKNEKVRINLEEVEAFSKDKVVIPAYHPRFAEMAVLKTR
ncbi:MAG TPA: hypothetical protein VGM30_05125 [Puia sp.]|jgi:hypothetical protein